LFIHPSANESRLCLSSAGAGEYEGIALARFHRGTPQGGVSRGGLMNRLKILPIFLVPFTLMGRDDPKAPPPGQMTTTTATTATTTTTSSPTGAVSPSEQTVVVPGSPDVPNREGSIRT